MNKTELKSIWKKEENVAHIHGWDFSHIYGRYIEGTIHRYLIVAKK